MSNYHEIYRKDETGKLVLVSQTEVPAVTQEEVIASKEAELLQMYAELKALKGE